MPGKLFNKALILLTIVSFGFSNAALAEYHPNKTQETPDALLKHGIYKVVDFLRNSSTRDLGQILKFIDSEIAGYFDFARMTKLAAGRYARNMTQNELEKLEHKIRAAFIRSLSKNLVDYAYTNKNIRFFKPRRSQFGNEVTVTAMITHPHGYPTRIAFKFHPTPKGWKVYDLSANGQSAILHYRSMIKRTRAANSRYGGTHYQHHRPQYRNY